MRWIAVTAGVLLVAGLVGSEEKAAEEESPLIYTLEVNGLTYLIKPGELLTLPAQEGPVKLRLKIERLFRAAGVEFRFPQAWQLRRHRARARGSTGPFGCAASAYTSRSDGKNAMPPTS